MPKRMGKADRKADEKTDREADDAAESAARSAWIRLIAPFSRWDCNTRRRRGDGAGPAKRGEGSQAVTRREILSHAKADEQAVMIQVQNG